MGDTQYSLVPVDHDPFATSLTSTMTHQPEQRSPAQQLIHGALDTLSQFGKGGLYEVLKNNGVSMPDWVHRAGSFFQNDSVNSALGTISGAGRMERFSWPVTTAYGRTIEMPITVNPSRSAIQRALAEAPHGDVRALKAPSGDVYLWPANEAMHVDIANSFDLPFKTRADLQKSSYLFSKKDVDALGKFSNFDDLVSRLGSADMQ